MGVHTFRAPDVIRGLALQKQVPGQARDEVAMLIALKVGN